METLTVDGHAVDLDEAEQRFAAAMAAPGPDEAEHPAPPKRAPVDAEAPFGRKADGTPKKGPGGRPPKARVTEAPGSPQDGKKTTAPPDYTQPLMEFTQGLWMLCAVTPVPSDDLRVKVRAQGYVLKQNAAGVAQSVNLMAQHNSTVRWGVEKLTQGNAGWVLPAMLALVPFAAQSAAIWRNPVTPEMAQLAQATELEWDAQVAAIRAEMGLDEESPQAA